MSATARRIAAAAALSLLPALLAPPPAAAAPDGGSPQEASPGAGATGRISWYGQRFAGRRTASGEPFDPSAMTMAHPTWPMHTIVRVTNLRNDRSVVVRVNDRGPHTGRRIADVSQEAARRLGMTRRGVIVGRIEPLGVSERLTAPARPADGADAPGAATAPGTR